MGLLVSIAYMLYTQAYIGMYIFVCMQLCMYTYMWLLWGLAFCLSLKLLYMHLLAKPKANTGESTRASKGPIMHKNAKQYCSREPTEQLGPRVGAETSLAAITWFWRAFPADAQLWSQSSDPLPAQSDKSQVIPGTCWSFPLPSTSQLASLYTWFHDRIQSRQPWKLFAVFWQCQTRYKSSYELI